MNDDRIAEVYKGEIGSEAQHERARRRIHWMISQAQGTRVLDIGCSQGTASILLGREGFHVTGIDIQDSRIEYAEADLALEARETRKRVTFQQADGEKLEFEDESFDSVLLGEVIEHLNDPRRILAEATRVLRPHGVLILTTPFGFLHHHDHRQTFYVDDVFSLISAHVGILSAEIGDRYFRIVGRKGAETDSGVLESLRRQADDVVLAIQQDLDEVRRQLLRQSAELDKAKESMILEQKRAEENEHKLARFQAAWRETKAELQEAKLRARSLSAELKEVTVQARAATRMADDLEKARRILEKRDRELRRLRYRLEVSDWKLVSMRQRRWWRIGTQLGEVRRRPRALLTLPTRLLRVIRTREPRLPRPTPPPGIKTKRASQLADSENRGQATHLNQPIRPRHDLAALVLVTPELRLQISHEVTVFAMDLDAWHDQMATLCPQLVIVESGAVDTPSPQLSELLLAATAAGIRSVLWDTTPSLVPDAQRQQFDVIVGDGLPTSDTRAGQFVKRRGLIQPRVHNPIGSSRKHKSADVDLGKHVLADESYPALSDLAIASKNYRVLRSTSPTMVADLAAVAATATPVVVPSDSQDLGISADSDEMADAMERSLLRSEVLRARLTHPQMRHVLREFSISADVTAVLSGTEPRWPQIDIMVATKRPENLGSLFANLGSQTYPDFRVFLVAHGIELDENETRERACEAGIRLESLTRVPEEVILGEVFNIGFDHTEAAIVAKVDDDDFYGAEYLWDLYSALDFSGAEVAGKWAHYAYLEGVDSLVYRYPKHEHRFTDIVAISTLLMRREVLEAERFPAMPWGSGSVFLRSLGAQGARVFAADRWNYLYVRGRDGNRNTFPISDLKLLSISDVICRGMNIDEVVL